MKRLPKMSCCRLSPTFDIEAIDQFDNVRTVQVAGESALTLLVDGTELVTLMTLGTYPEELALGYLHNQYLLESIEDIESVTVDWERERANIITHDRRGIAQDRTTGRTVTTGCGQGTIFSCTIDKLYEKRLPDVALRQSVIYALLREIGHRNEIYKAAGAVHGCALCSGDKILLFVEDVGRHNAADAIAGMMWLEGIGGEDKIFYTTGRLTSEILMKVARMGIPVLLSRSGVTYMGLELARDLNVTMIARAKGRAFLVYNNKENIIYDEKPARAPPAAPKN